MRKVNFLILFIILTGKVYASSMRDIIFNNIIPKLKSELEFSFTVEEKIDCVGDTTFNIQTEDNGIIIVDGNDGSTAYFSTSNSEEWILNFYSIKNNILKK